MKVSLKMKRITILSFIFIWLMPLKGTSLTERPDNELPMYGDNYDPEVQPNKEMSQSAAKLGWQYYYNQDLDTAIKRFNQAWMFDRNSVDAFWGFGVIMGQRGMNEDPEYHFKESIRFLEKANELSPNNARILVDLAYTHTMLAYFLKIKSQPNENKHFAKAKKYYEKAQDLEPGYPLLYANWSTLEFYQGNITEAKKQLDRAKELGFTPVPGYEEELQKKLEI